MEADTFWTLLDRYPSVAKVMLRDMAQVIRVLSDRVVEFSTIGARNRLHAELLRLARDAGASNNTAELVPAPTHAELASRISSHREAVSREMRRLATAGLVERRSRRLRILDIDRLAAMVHEAKGVGDG